MITQLLEMVSESKHTDTYAYDKIAPLNIKLCLEVLFWNHFVKFLLLFFFLKNIKLGSKKKTWLERVLLKCCPCIPGPIMQTTQAYLFQGQKCMVRTIATFQRNIVGRNMLRAFGHPVARCCDMLGVGSNLKIAKFFMQHLWMLLDAVVVWPGSCNSVAPGGHAH